MVNVPLEPGPTLMQGESKHGGQYQVRYDGQRCGDRSGPLPEFEHAWRQSVHGRRTGFGVRAVAPFVPRDFMRLRRSTSDGMQVEISGVPLRT